MISNEIDKQLLNCQRQKGRLGSLIGIDHTSNKSEQKKYKRLDESEKRKKREKKCSLVPPGHFEFFPLKLT